MVHVYVYIVSSAIRVVDRDGTARSATSAAGNPTVVRAAHSAARPEDAALTGSGAARQEGAVKATTSAAERAAAPRVRKRANKREHVDAQQVMMADVYHYRHVLLWKPERLLPAWYNVHGQLVLRYEIWKARVPHVSSPEHRRVKEDEDTQ